MISYFLRTDFPPDSIEDPDDVDVSGSDSVVDTHHIEAFQQTLSDSCLTSTRFASKHIDSCLTFTPLRFADKHIDSCLTSTTLRFAGKHAQA